MKITRQCYTDYTKDELKCIKANEGCDVCPNCGEKKPFYITKKREKKGIYKSLFPIYKTNLFKCERRDCYKCYTCGCEWQSDLY